MTTTVSYYNEISNMMFGFGDSHSPNRETVRLVESITLNQLRLIVQEATKVREVCKNPDIPQVEKNEAIGAEELIFLMRKNKYKMRRFLKYLHSQMQKTRATSCMQPVVPPAQSATKYEVKYNKLIDFIEYIDETGELSDLSEYDEVKNERMIRADRISLALDEEAYMKFSKARCTSFRKQRMSQIRNFEHLKLWIDPRNIIHFTNDAMDVLSYYAYETVAQIIDYALLVRLDHNRQADPLGNLPGTHYNAGMFKVDQMGGNNPDYSRVYSGQPAISVAEVKEVMRRIYLPQAGLLNFGKKLPAGKNIIAI